MPFAPYIVKVHEMVVTSSRIVPQSVTLEFQTVDDALRVARLQRAVGLHPVVTEKRA